VLKPKTRRRLDGSLREARPQQAVHRAKVDILDTVGVTVAGSVESAREFSAGSFRPRPAPSPPRSPPASRRTSAL